MVLLEELDLPWESLGSATFKNSRMKVGIEPDDCFYLTNCQAIVGKKRLDLDIDPLAGTDDDLHARAREGCETLVYRWPERRVS